MTRLKSLIRPFVPAPLVAAYHGYRESKLNITNQRMTTEEVFTDIYRRNRWGGAAGTFFSGSGSHEDAVVAPYVSSLRAELNRLGAESMVVVDLGCGDFSIGERIARHCGTYIGVDIVGPLIERNQKEFSSAKVSFVKANIIEDALPAGDICLLRQVLQHLSNSQIDSVLPKLERYRWSFITEHQPSPPRLKEPNRDKPHGDNIRIRNGSGVFLEQPPFNVPSSRYQLLWEVPGTSMQGAVDPGVIRTFMLHGTT
jgi:hypothetical protein